MNDLYAGPAKNAAVAAALALAISIIAFSLAGQTMGSSIVVGVGIAAVTFGIAWAIGFFVLRSRRGA